MYKLTEQRRAYFRKYQAKRRANPEIRERERLRLKKWREDHNDKYRESIRKHNLENPMQIKAQAAVRQKVHFKRWPKASELLCSICGKQANHYHHNFGYEQQHWYDVIPVCKLCHEELHKCTM